MYTLLIETKMYFEIRSRALTHTILFCRYLHYDTILL